MMLPDWATRPHADAERASQGRRILDTAEGILIALRRCPADAAFRELVDASHKHGVPVFTIAWALVNLTTGEHCAPHAAAAARRAAQQEWRELLGE